MAKTDGANSVTSIHDDDSTAYIRDIIFGFNDATCREQKYISDPIFCGVAVTQAILAVFQTQRSEAGIIKHFVPIYRNRSGAGTRREIITWTAGVYCLADTLLEHKGCQAEREELKAVHDATQEALANKNYAADNTDFTTFSAYTTTLLNPDREDRLVQKINLAQTTNMGQLFVITHIPTQPEMTPNEVVAKYFLGEVIKLHDPERSMITAAYRHGLEQKVSVAQNLVVVTDFLRNKQDIDPAYIKAVTTFYEHGIAMNEKEHAGRTPSMQTVDVKPSGRRQWIVNTNRPNDRFPAPLLGRQEEPVRKPVGF